MLSNLISQLKEAKAEDRYYDVLAEIPRIREESGYPPLVTPTSQIVGTQAVMNILGGERYKMVGKEFRAMMRGEYGTLPAPVNEEIRKKCIGDDEVITCRPADLLPPEFDKLTAEIGDLAQCEEDVLSYALFPQVATAFFENRRKKESGIADGELIAVIAAAIKAYQTKAARPPDAVQGAYPQDTEQSEHLQDVGQSTRPERRPSGSGAQIRNACGKYATGYSRPVKTANN